MPLAISQRGIVPDLGGVLAYTDIIQRCSHEDGIRDVRTAQRDCRIPAGDLTLEEPDDPAWEAGMATIREIQELADRLKEISKADSVILNFAGDAADVFDEARADDGAEDGDVRVVGRNDPAFFSYGLNHRVALLSGEEGEIIGRAEYAEGFDSYLIRYTAADGRLVEGWWNEPAIRDVADEENAALT